VSASGAMFPGHAGLMGSMPRGEVPARDGGREGHSQDQATRLRELVRAITATNPPAAGKPALRKSPLLAITSGKGGVGKTTLAVNLSIALAQRGVRVTLLDADLGMANADVMCGLNPARRLEMALSHDASRRTLSELSLEAPGGFRLIPGSVGIARIAALTAPQRVEVLEQLAAVGESSDLIIIDTGAGLSPGVLGFAEAADLTLIAVTPEPTSIADAYAMAKCLRLGAGMVAKHENGLGGRAQSVELALVVNQVENEAEGHAVHGRLDAVATKFLKQGLDLAGFVRRDENVPLAIRARQPVMLRASASPASADVRSLCEYVGKRLSLRLAQQQPAPRRFLRFFSRPL
jgi:flagellar biosynthesis protein FlhG